MGVRQGRESHCLGSILALALVALPPAAFAGMPHPAPPRAQGGVIDLRSWDFGRDGPVPLSGEWTFFGGALLAPADAAPRPSGQLREVPDFWRGDEAGGSGGSGAGTYRLRLLLPGAEPELAIRFTTVSTAFRLFANGQELASAGVPALSASAARAAYAPGVAGLPAASEIDLTVWVSNHEYRTGGMWRAFSIGTRQQLTGIKRRNDLLSFALVGFILAIAISRMAFYVFRPKERSSLFLFLFALTVALRTLVTGEYDLTQLFPGIGFDLLIRLEYCTAYLSVPLAALFFLSFFPDEASPLLRLLLTLPSLPFLLLIPFAPLPLLTRSVLFYYPIAFPSLAAMLALILLPAILHRRAGGWPMLAGGLFIGAAAVNDMLYSSFIIYTGNLLPLGLTLFVGFQALVLAKRFTTAYSEVESLSGKLSTTNERLEREIAQSVVVQGQLKAALSEKELLLREVHHRVKNSLQIVSSIAALQAHRAKEPAAITAYATIRSRLRAISMVHERLYGLASGESIDFGEYARDLVGQLAASFGVEGERVDLSVEADRIDAPMDFCIDAGLLLTELVSNAYKHAIIPSGGGRIHVTLRREAETVEVAVEDDGPGLPPDFAPERGASLGFRIATSLLGRLNGRYVFGAPGNGRRGARVGVALPLAAAEVVLSPAEGTVR